MSDYVGKIARPHLISTLSLGVAMEYKAASEKDDTNSSSDSSFGEPGSPPSTDSSLNLEDSTAFSSTSSDLYNVVRGLAKIH